MKKERHVVIIAKSENRSDVDINNFLNAARSFVHEDRCELDSCDGRVLFVSKRNTIHNT